MCWWVLDIHCFSMFWDAKNMSFVVFMSIWATCILCCTGLGFVGGPRKFYDWEAFALHSTMGGGTMSQHVSTLRTQETLLASYCQISSSIFGKRWKKELLGPQLADPSIIYCMTVWDELRDSRIFTVWIWTSVQATWAMRGTRNVDFDPDRCSQQMTKVTSRNSGSR